MIETVFALILTLNGNMIEHYISDQEKQRVVFTCKMSYI